MMSRAFTLGFALVLAVGCRARETEDRAPAVGNKPTEGARAETATALPVITVTRVDIDTKLAALCGIASSQVFFDFDGTKLEPAAKERLDKIARCATEGPAQGKQLRIVGRADPRGDEAYNKQLGMGRADTVAKYLSDQGVKQARTESASRGEAAAADDPAKWPLDRRVTITLDESNPQ